MTTIQAQQIFILMADDWSSGLNALELIPSCHEPGPSFCPCWWDPVCHLLLLVRCWPAERIRSLCHLSHLCHRRGPLAPSLLETANRQDFGRFWFLWELEMDPLQMQADGGWQMDACISDSPSKKESTAQTVRFSIHLSEMVQSPRGAGRICWEGRHWKEKLQTTGIRRIQALLRAASCTYRHLALLAHGHVQPALQNYWIVEFLFLLFFIIITPWIQQIPLWMPLVGFYVVWKMILLSITQIVLPCSRFPSLRRLHTDQILSSWRWPASCIMQAINTTRIHCTSVNPRLKVYSFCKIAEEKKE